MKILTRILVKKKKRKEKQSRVQKSQTE